MTDLYKGWNAYLEEDDEDSYYDIPDEDIDS